MTEPTAEQVAREGEAAQAFAEKCCSDFGCDFLSLAEITYEAQKMLASVRIEAHAAGRDEGLEAAADVAEGYDGDEIAYDIRALRGRT